MTPTHSILAAIGVTLAELRERNRHKTRADQRRLAYVLLNRHGGMTVQEIATLLHRARPTVYYGIASWDQNYAVDRHVRAMTHAAMSKLNLIPIAA